MSSPWLGSGLVEVLLPSGFRVRGVLPAIRDLARRDLLTDGLLEVAMRGADPAWFEEGHVEERHAMRRRFVDELMAAFPREVQDPGSDEWVPVDLGVTELAALPGDDQEMLERLVLRTATPEVVTAASIALLAGAAPEVAPADGWEDFRGLPDGAAGGPDGAALGTAPERPPRRARRRQRVPAGRGAGDAADRG